MTNEFVKLIGPAQLEIERTLPASCERVWQYIVDPELRKKWFCAGQTGSKAGEKLVMDFDHTRLSRTEPPEGDGCGQPMVLEGTILVFEPPNKLSYRWPGMNPEEGSIVTIELTPDGENTRLRLTHSQLTNPEFLKGASAGWHTHLDLLVDFCSGKEVRDFWIHYNKLKSEYDSKLANSSS